MKVKHCVGGLCSSYENVCTFGVCMSHQFHT